MSRRQRFIRCPVCGSTARRCKRPSGHDAAEWHREREDAEALANRDHCLGCAWWLTELAAGRDPLDHLDASPAHVRHWSGDPA